MTNLSENKSNHIQQRAQKSVSRNEYKSQYNLISSHYPETFRPIKMAENLQASEQSLCFARKQLHSDVQAFIIKKAVQIR